MMGQTICHIHGGKAPQNIRAARKRLLEMSGVAMQALLYAMDHGDIKEATSAATKVLDRAGIGPTATIDLTDPSRDDLSGLTEEQLAERAEAIADELRTAHDETD